MEGHWGVADVLAANKELGRPTRLVFGLFVSLILVLFLSVAVARPAQALGNDDGVAVTRSDDDEEDDESDDDDDDTDTDEEENAAKEEGGEGTNTSADVQGQQANGTKDSNTSNGGGGNDNNVRAGGDTDSETSADVAAANEGDDTDSESSGGHDQGGQVKDEDDVLGDVEQRGPNVPAGPGNAGGAGPDVLGTRFGARPRGQGPAVAPAVQGRAKSRGQQLPFTGTQIAGLLAAAAGFVTSGLVLARKRRRS